MKVKLLILDHAPGMIDPHSKRTPFIVADPDDPTKTSVVAVAEVPETSFWVRRVLDGEIERVEEDKAPAPAAPAPSVKTASVKPATKSEG